jgi:SPP1 gp7 family putative phage head morphogenesis protein
MQKVIEPQLVEAATGEGIRLAAEVGVQFDPAVVNVAMVEWAANYSYELIKGLTETTRKIVANAVSGFAATPGMTRGELVKMLEPAFGPVRAESIAISETTRAYSAAQSQYKEDLAGYGITTEETWQTSNDELVCPICGELNGKPESEWKDRYPNGPPAHTRCRCSKTLRVVEAH